MSSFAVGHRDFLGRLEDKVYSTVAFPYAVFVFITFWTLYSIDRDLVFPEFLDDYVPAALNHMMHSS